MEEEKFSKEYKELKKEYKKIKKQLEIKENLKKNAGKFWKCNQCHKYIGDVLYYVIDCKHKFCQNCCEIGSKACSLCSDNNNHEIISINLKSNQVDENSFSSIEET